SGVDCGVAEAGRDVGFADSGRADQEHVGRGVEVAAGGEVGQEGAGDGGGGSEVEVVRGGSGGEVREPEPTGEPAGVGGGDLDGEEALQGLGQGPALGPGLVEDAGQRVGGVGEFQLG